MLEILYCDAHLIAVHKPAGMLVHRSNLDRHETRFAVQLLRDQIGRHVFPAHRLDKGTSGVLLFALDRETASLLGQQFERNAVGKTYRAIVRGWPPEAGLIDHALSLPFDDYGRRLGPDAPRLAAITRFRRLATVELPDAVDRYPSSRYALVELEPLTGRQHQLRRHMKHLSHPIIGDATWGKGLHNRFFCQRFGNQRMLLACTRLELWHPYLDAPLCIEAPLEKNFADLVTALGWHVDMEMPS